MRKATLIAVVALTACAGERVVAPVAPAPDPEDGRRAGIYAAVVRQLVTTGDSTFGDDPDFPVIYVVERAVLNAAEPDEGGRQGDPFSAELKRMLVAELDDLLVRFVPDGDSVIIPVEEGGGVEGDGVVVTLGPVEGQDPKVEVQSSLYAGPLAGTWLTYVVEAKGDDWEITGTSGPVAIS